MNIFTRTISAAENSVDRLTETAGDRLDSFKETAKNSVENTLEKTDNYLLDNLTNNLKASVDSSINSWFADHPVILWLLHHPIISLIALAIATVLIVRLFIAIYVLITTTIDRLWLGILKSPLWVLRKVFGWKIKEATNGTTTITNYELTTDSQKLQEICDRLDTLQQQQQQILQEIAYLKQQETIELGKFNLMPAIDSQVRS